MGNTGSQWDNGRPHTDKVARELLDWSTDHDRPIYWMWTLGPTGHHAAGRALDFMSLTEDQSALRNNVGNHLAAYVRANWRRLGVEYVIWRQRIWNATRDDDNPDRRGWSEWRRMEDRGSPTANHLDHVHVSLLDNPPKYQPPPQEDFMADIEEASQHIWGKQRIGLSDEAMQSGYYGKGDEHQSPAQMLRAADYQSRKAVHELADLRGMVAGLTSAVQALTEKVDALSREDPPQ